MNGLLGILIVVVGLLILIGFIALPLMFMSALKNLGNLDKMLLKQILPAIERVEKSIEKLANSNTDLDSGDDDDDDDFDETLPTEEFDSEEEIEEFNSDFQSNENLRDFLKKLPK